MLMALKVIGDMVSLEGRRYLRFARLLYSATKEAFSVAPAKDARKDLELSILTRL
jgi:hypothetical protein